MNKLLKILTSNRAGTLDGTAVGKANVTRLSVRANDAASLREEYVTSDVAAAVSCANAPAVSVRAKLASAAGETLSEVLVSILIAGLSTVMFFGMITAASTISRESWTALDASYNQASALEMGMSDAATNTSVSDASGTVIVRSEGASWAKDFSLETKTYTATNDNSAVPLIRYEAVKNNG